MLSDDLFINNLILDVYYKTEEIQYDIDYKNFVTGDRLRYYSRYMFMGDV